jgi:hypothetical protein
VFPVDGVGQFLIASHEVDLRAFLSKENGEGCAPGSGTDDNGMVEGHGEGVFFF